MKSDIITKVAKASTVKRKIVILKSHCDSYGNSCYVANDECIFYSKLRMGIDCCSDEHVKFCDELAACEKIKLF